MELNTTNNTNPKVINPIASNVSDRSWIVLIILSIFLGCFGVDRFYAGRIGLGLLKLFLCGFFGIWWFIDVIIALTGTMKDSQNRYIQPL
ncbi:TM2 domain-containing protein [[Mycoplasma] cavipharyngis]|uniref:TM2 domain-containing protein n=1 Tax=[Mycoplasma] cavipharyngis TaxID=92757 RepID=UPI003704593A